MSDERPPDAPREDVAGAVGEGAANGAIGGSGTRADASQGGDGVDDDAGAQGDASPAAAEDSTDARIEAKSSPAADVPSNDQRAEPADPPEDTSLPAWAERVNANLGEVIPLGLKKAAPPPPATPPPLAAALAARAAGGGMPPKSGILSIDKPSGMTSHDVVQALRRASGEQRIGHAGTLDPMATGVLVVCLGSATRVVEEVQQGLKGYRARVTLGASTSTYDAEGEVLASADPSGVSEADIEAALERFRGEIQQIPPMVSALKQGGKRLYELARKGIEVERAPRDVTVHRLELVDWSPPDATLELTVTSGTYVRSIAHDLGQALGVGAHLSALQRTFVGPFALADAVPLATAVEAFTEGWWPPLLHPLDMALTAYDALIVDAAIEKAMRDGQQFDGPRPRARDRRRIRVYEAETGFVGVARWDDLTERWQPERVFPKASARP